MASFLIGKLLVPCLALLVHLIPALGFNNSGVGVGDANNVVCLEGERQALLQLKKGFVDDYGKLSSWRSEDEKKNCCNWEGVYCSNQTGHVVELHLGTTLSQPQPLSGMISSSLLELPYLTFLDLSSNDFNQSHIPEFFSSLSNLKHLDLSFANLSGSISPKLKNLSHLQYLNLGWNVLKINENLKWLSHLSSIEYLDLSSTNLNVSNDWLEVVSHLPKLKSLILSNCAHPPMSLSSLPSFNHSKSFTSLESLVLDRNQLKVGIPKFLGDICSLRELDLRFTNINGKLVDVIKNLSGCAKDSLEVLHLDFNQITGSLPDFTIFPSLEQLSLEANIINGTVPKSIGNLSKLVVLDVSSNFLRGIISEAHFSNLSKLLYLDLSNNSLALEVSSTWVPPFQAKVIHLKSCKLGSKFPNWIQTQKNLYQLFISFADISDTIPAEWLANLPPTLRHLSLSSSQIYGRLPDVSMSKNGLTAFGIDLSDNRLEGPLPIFPANLTMLNLARNRFFGSISSVCKINDGLFRYLDLSDNMFSGQLPNCFVHWQNLIILNLAGNSFSGKVPSSLGLLSQLKTLSMSDNNFSGDIISSLKNCSSLQVIDLGNNRFFGKVPAWIGEDLPGLKVLILHSNQFVGSMPLQMCWLQNLRILDLSQNEISGTIPYCLNNLTAMAQDRDSINYSIFSFPVISTFADDYRRFLVRYVDSAMIVSKGREDKYANNLGLLKIINLSGNKMTGKLPNEISSLLGLVGLNLSRNNFIGEIPRTIGQLKKLETLDLAWNQFSGEIPATFSSLNFLNHLNLSHNNFSGKIPTATQLQSFNAYDFAGNPELCGLPLSQECQGEQTPKQTEETEESRDEFWKWFYIAAGLGFGVSFWAVCGSLMLNRTWRHAYFLL